MGTKEAGRERRARNWRAGKAAGGGGGYDTVGKSESGGHERAGSEKKRCGEEDVRAVVKKAEVGREEASSGPPCGDW